VGAYTRHVTALSSASEDFFSAAACATRLPHPHPVSRRCWFATAYMSGLDVVENQYRASFAANIYIGKPFHYPLPVNAGGSGYNSASQFFV